MLSAWQITLALLIGTPLLIFWLTALLNIPFLLRLQTPSEEAVRAAPFVSLLIPARNEAAVIGATVARLLAQTHTAFELLVLDDNSDDGTGAIALAAAAGDARLRVLAGAPLPAGWLGKNWACHQLAQAARGDWLIFTDADVIWQPTALGAVVAAAQGERADMLTVWPTQTTLTWGERLTVPLMALAILAYLPLPAVHYLPLRIFAAANGQCLALRRAAYAAIGGHAAVRNNIVEDVALARLTKQHALRLRMFDGNRLVGCRMYNDWDGVRRGFGKNILAGHANSVPFLLFSTLLHWAVFIGPWLWLVAALWTGSTLWLPLVLALAGVGVRMLTAILTHQRAADALLMPVSALLMTRIAHQALVWRLRGQTEWKGRVVA